jgi:transcriptional regulator with XRE-family HTH domain
MEERTKTQCAEHLGITRQRYALMEEGKMPIGAAELEELVRYLRIPAYAVWPAEQDEWQGKERLVYVQAQGGESVHVIIGPYDAENVPESFSHEYTETLSDVQKSLWPRDNLGVRR